MLTEQVLVKIRHKIRSCSYTVTATSGGVLSNTSTLVLASMGLQLGPDIPAVLLLKIKMVPLSNIGKAAGGGGFTADVGTSSSSFSLASGTTSSCVWFYAETGSVPGLSIVLNERTDCCRTLYPNVCWNVNINLRSSF